MQKKWRPLARSGKNDSWLLFAFLEPFKEKKWWPPILNGKKKIMNPPPYWKKKKIMTMFQFSFSVQVVFSCMFIIFSNHYLCIGVGSTRWPQDKKQFFFISGSLSTRPERQLFIGVKWFVYIVDKSVGTSTRPEWQHFMGVKWFVHIVDKSVGTRPERQLFIGLKWFVHVADKSVGTRPERQLFIGLKWFVLTAHRPPGIVFQSVYTMLLYGQLSFSVTMFQFSFSVQVVVSCMFIIFSNHYLCIGVGGTRWPQDKKGFIFLFQALSARDQRDSSSST